MVKKKKTEDEGANFLNLHQTELGWKQCQTAGELKATCIQYRHVPYG